MQPKKKIKVKIGKLLLEKGAITKEQLGKALELQRSKYKDKRLGEVMLKENMVNEDDLCGALAAQFGYPYIKIENYSIDKEVLSFVSQKTAQELKLVPVDKIGSILTVAMLNPLDEPAIKKIADASGLSVKAFTLRPSELDDAINNIYTAG